MSAAGLKSGIFRDRTEVGRELAAKLDAYRNDPAGLILALPRGGVPVGYEISLALNLPLDVFITRKLAPRTTRNMPSVRSRKPAPFIATRKPSA